MCLSVCKACRSARQLVFCVLFVLKVTSCICLCIRPAEALGSFSFVFLIRLVKGKALRKK